MAKPGSDESRVGAANSGGDDASAFNAKRPEVLQAMFRHYADVGLDHQRQLATTSNILLILSGAILTIIGLDEALGSPIDVVGAVTVAAVGFFGMVWSWKQHQTYHYWTRVARSYQRELDGLFEPALEPALARQEAAEKESARQYGRFTAHQLRIRHLWVGLHGLVMALGSGLAVVILLVRGDVGWAAFIGVALLGLLPLLLIAMSRAGRE